MAAGTHRRSAALPSFVSIGAAAAAAESLFLHQLASLHAKDSNSSVSALCPPHVRRAGQGKAGQKKGEGHTQGPLLVLMFAHCISV